MLFEHLRNPSQKGALEALRAGVLGGSPSVGQVHRDTPATLSVDVYRRGEVAIGRFCFRVQPMLASSATKTSVRDPLSKLPCPLITLTHFLPLRPFLRIWIPAPSDY